MDNRKFFIWMLLFPLLSSCLPAEDVNSLDIESAVAAGLRNSFSVKAERENLYKKRLSLKSVKPFGSMAVVFNGDMTVNWSPEQNPSLSGAINSVVTLPVMKRIDLITEYTADKESLTGDENNGSVLLGINIKPLSGLREISSYDNALYNLDRGKLSLANGLIKTEFAVRSAYIEAVNNISARKLLELKFINSSNIWTENKKRFGLGFTSRSTLEESYLEKLKAAESLEQGKENEYISLLKLSRIINKDISGTELKPLFLYKNVDIDKDQLVKSALANNFLLKQSKLKLQIMRRTAGMIKNDFIPDISIVPGINIPVIDPGHWSSSISVNMELSLDRSSSYSLEKMNIDITRQERGITIIRDKISDSIEIAVYKYNTEQKKLEYLTAFLDHENTVLIQKEREFQEKSLRRTELESARIDVLDAENNLQTASNDLWLLWYSMEALKNGYAGSLE